MPKYGRKRVFVALITVLQHMLYYFSTLKVILSRSDVPFPRYGKKLLLAGFEIGFTTFTALFLALSSYFESIGSTVANIWAKTCVCQLIKGFYGIRCSFISTFKVIFR